MPPKLSFDKIKEEFEKRNCVLLSKERKNCKYILEFLCPNGHFNKKHFNHFMNSKCGYCSQKVKLKYDDIKKIFEKENYQLSSTKYKNNYTKLDYICPEGHKGSISIKDFKFGYRCWTCGIRKRQETQKLNYDEVKSRFEKEEYTLISETYENSRSLLNVMCPYGHIVQTDISRFTRGIRCNQCKHKNEEKCREIFQKYFNVPFPKKRPKFLQKLELDGYNEKLKIAFEYNGRQHYDKKHVFHKTEKDFESYKERDERKKILCEKNKVKLFIIPYTIKFENLENHITKLLKET